MTTKYFLKNNLNSILSTRDGTLDIPAYGYAQIREQDCENLTVLYATERKWAEIVNVEPTDAKPVKEEVKIEITEPFQGLTLEELKAEQAAKAKAKEEAEAKAAEVPATDAADATPKAKKATK